MKRAVLPEFGVWLSHQTEEALGALWHRSSLDITSLASARVQLLVEATPSMSPSKRAQSEMDAFLVNLGGPGYLLHNTTPNPGHWTLIKLVGTKSNRDGIGAVVEVTAGGRKQRAERVAGQSYLSQDDGRLHFGLGKTEAIESIHISWPSGMKQTLKFVPVDRVITIEEK